MKHTYKVLISEKSYLKVKLRAMRLSGTFIDEIYYNKKDLLFRTRSGTDPRLTWFQTIRITDLEKLEEISKTKDLDRVIRESGIKVHCTCLQSGTLIKTKNGDKPIQLITNNDYVLSSDGRYHRVIKVLCSIKKEWIDLFLSNGKFLSLTGEHRVRYNNGEKVTVKEAKNIKVGDNLVELKNITIYQGSTQWLDNYKNVEVVSVTKRIGQDRFFDICLADKPHDYIANGVVVKNCPAFLYWGFKAMAWKNGYGLEKELRMPRVRNPHQQGYVCFRKDSKVLTKSGYRDIQDIKVGDYVYSHTGNLRKVLRVFKLKANSLIRIRIGEKNNIYCTPNHKFIAYNYRGKSNPSALRFKKENVEWIKAEDLIVGNMLVSPFLTNPEEVIVENRKAFMAGLYASDGGVSGKRCKNSNFDVVKNNYAIYFLNIALHGDYIDEYKRIFDSYNISYHEVNEKRDTKGKIVSIDDSDIKQFCVDLCNFTYKDEDSKELKDEIIFWNKEAKKEFVRGFFLGDGTIVEGAGKKGNNTTYVTLFNTNKDIINKIYLLLKEEFDVNIDYYDRKPFEEFGHMIYPKRMYFIRITGQDVKKFIREWLKGVEKLKGGYREDLNMSDYKVRNYDLMFKSDKPYKVTPKIIKEIERLDTDEYVYNLEVQEDNTYIVQGVALSNCKHLYQCCMVYPFISKTVAMKMKRYFKPIDDKKEKERQEQEERDKKFKEKFGNDQGNNNGNV